MGEFVSDVLWRSSDRFALYLIALRICFRYSIGVQ